MAMPGPLCSDCRLDVLVDVSIPSILFCWFWCTGEHANTDRIAMAVHDPASKVSCLEFQEVLSGQERYCNLQEAHLTRNARQCSHDLKHPVPQHPGFNQGLVDEIRIDHLCDETLRGLKEFLKISEYCGKLVNATINQSFFSLINHPKLEAGFFYVFLICLSHCLQKWDSGTSKSHKARELFSVLARGTAGWLNWEAGVGVPDTSR